MAVTVEISTTQIKCGLGEFTSAENCTPNCHFPIETDFFVSVCKVSSTVIERLGDSADIYHTCWRCYLEFLRYF